MSAVDECNVCMDDSGTKLPCCEYRMCPKCVYLQIQTVRSHIYTRTLPYRGVDLRALDKSLTWFICPGCAHCSPVIAPALAAHVFCMREIDSISPERASKVMNETINSFILYVLELSVRAYTFTSSIESPSMSKCTLLMHKFLDSESKRGRSASHVPKYTGFYPLPRPPRQSIVYDWFSRKREKAGDVVMYIEPNPDVDNVLPICPGCGGQYIQTYRLRACGQETSMIEMCHVCTAKLPMQTAMWSSQISVLGARNVHTVRLFEWFTRKQQIKTDRLVARETVHAVVAYIYTWIGNALRPDNLYERHRNVFAFVDFQKFMAASLRCGTAPIVN